MLQPDSGSCWLSPALSALLHPAPARLDELLALLESPAALRQALSEIDAAPVSCRLRFLQHPQPYRCRLQPMLQANGAGLIQGVLEPETDQQALLKRWQAAQATMFSQLAHDVRNALSSVGGFSQLLRRRKLVSGEAESLIERIQQAAENAHQLLQEMTFSRDLVLSVLVPKDFETLLQGLLRSVASQARDKGLSFHSSLAAPLIPPAIPPALFERLLQQMLFNALRFTPAGGEIRLSLQHVRGGLRLGVSDTAPLIPAELSSRLFDKVMLREERAGSLDLYLARQIVEAFGGHIWYEGADCNQFYLELPLI